jgi:AcrR family transcriptional regulator
MAAAHYFRPTDTSDPTRGKIMNAAGEIFAEHGFQAATVRDICAQAGVNGAAVNYYFGDKANLYLEVLRQSAGPDHAAEIAALNLPPEEALRALIRSACLRMLAGERPSWEWRLMAHEMSRPTPALDQVVEEVIAPKYQHLRNTVGAMLNLPPENETTRMCAHSIIAQVIHYAVSRPVISRLWPELETMPQPAEMLADHIARFSVYAVKEIARKAH